MSTESAGNISFGTQIATVIRAARTGLGWSQQVLATATGISKPTIARIEMSNISPRADTIDTIIQVFRARGVEIEILDGEVAIKFRKSALLSVQCKANKAEPIPPSLDT